MNFFPQIGTGSVSQFPVRRTRKWRSIVNELESGERVILPDSSGGAIKWQLTLKDLSDQEVASINGLFALMQGQFGTFLFVDPFANLLGWTEDFSHADWQTGLLTVQTRVADPFGTTRASIITNASAGVQSLQQSLAIPGEYVTCFSLWISSDSEAEVTLTRDGRSKSFSASPTWSRVWLSCPGTLAAGESTYSLSLLAGHSVRVFGPQLEAQPFPSDYRPTTTARGLYQESRFDNDELRIVNTGPGLSSCEVVLSSRI